MLKPGQNRPSTPNNSKSPQQAGYSDALPHWRQGVRETVLSTATDGTLNFSVEGGSDNGEFAYLTDVIQNKVNYASGRLEDGDIVLEIQGQKVAGYTQRDVVAWLHHCCRNGNPVVLKTVSVGGITKDLRQFLNTRFQKGSVDHELQNTIRDNLYLRTVPVTTRVPREGEVNGVDYTFLSPDEFLALEHSGNLLESGLYEGHHYGTPKPSKEPTVGPPQSPGSAGNLNLLICGISPGAHPSSEGKRKRNRSNVEAMAAKNMDPEPTLGGAMMGSEVMMNNTIEPPPPVPGSPPSYMHASECPESPRSDLGPLPSNWEKAFTERGEPYFIDHNSGTSHWLDPRLSKFQKKSLEECTDDELPYGWEKIIDPQYGTYYIDHVNRKTQYENPVIQAKRAVQGSGAATILNEQENQDYLPAFRKPQNLSSTADGINMSSSSKHSKSHERPFFTRNPNELRGERIQSSLVKSARGLGFTIIGGDDSEEEFLQIKSVVPHAPAWEEGKLQTGDTLVYVNSTCVLGFTHHVMVSMFQSIAPGETVQLEVCRGYPLPFDPNDPNTEVVTTVAVNAPDSASSNVYVDRDGNLKSESYFDMDSSHTLNGSEDMVNSSVKSMPDLCSSEKIKNLQRPNSTDIILNDSSDLGLADFAESSLMCKPEFLSLTIVKGAMGFGFTIADSSYGQKVKKILDRFRCKNLMEGDILVDINNVNVRNMCHGEVVNVLKDCHSNQEASVTVQRGGSSSPGKNKLRRKEEPESPHKTMYKDASILGLYRSKTPTADLYSTQQKEVVPNRPKTPLVDTRNRPKTPTGQQTWNPENKMGDGSVMKLAGPQSPGSPSSAYEPFKNNFSCGYSRHDPQQLQLSNQLMSASISEGQHINTRQANFARSRSPGQELDYADNNSPGNFQQNDHPGRPDNRSPDHPGDYFGQYASQPFYNGYGGPYDGGYSYCETLPKEYTFHQQQQLQQQPGLPPGSMPPSSSGYYTSDSLGRRKESTSFEHEQPHPSTVTRLSRDLRWFSMGPTVRVYSAGPGMEWIETTATLVRQETGFGFRIVGGTEEGSQVSIGHIVPGGAADLDGRLCSGDEIVSVDTQNVLNSSHHHVVQLMGKAAANGRVTLAIRRRIPSHELQNYTRPEIGYPFDVTVSRRENEGFGFVIISSVNKAGSTIGRIINGSPAERCGQLHIGDRILAVNHMDIVNLHHGDIVNLIKDSGYTVTLTIGAPLDDSSSTTASQREEDGEEYHAIEINRGKRGFGFSIRGGQEFQNMPLFVLQIAENGPAALDNRLRVSDQIIEINGHNTKYMNHAAAIKIIRSGEDVVRLLVKRGGTVPGSTAGNTEASGSVAMGGMRPSSSLSQPSCATTPNGTNQWDRYPPS